mmetsp:Transcript_53749/g.114734  ORF Transcript_53749/g.114734 Transcript_53749/m.114734 type:complete len:291 (+) Transcript_53749:702-1574(+)
MSPIRGWSADVMLPPRKDVTTRSRAKAIVGKAGKRLVQTATVRGMGTGMVTDKATGMATGMATGVETDTAIGTVTDMTMATGMATGMLIDEATDGHAMGMKVRGTQERTGRRTRMGRSNKVKIKAGLVAGGVPLGKVGPAAAEEAVVVGVREAGTATREVGRIQQPKGAGPEVTGARTIVEKTVTEGTGKMTRVARQSLPMLLAKILGVLLHPRPRMHPRSQERSCFQNCQCFPDQSTKDHPSNLQSHCRKSLDNLPPKYFSANSRTASRAHPHRSLERWKSWMGSRRSP